ncbi:FadL [Desulforapulum autotrophicum HRM2]|uniref:FadL n=2 Tax=Desulforapulum autotrophicum TaxID=2296 RepID=C0QBJ2_DESAH|nr:FadL [Desulforapulum autotrophicum HRM2]
MKFRYSGFALAPVLMLLVVLSSSYSYGAGFGIFTQGAKALGQANAVVAHLDSPSAVFFNPALINQLSGTQMEFGTTLVVPTREFKSDLTGETYHNEDNVYFPSTVYMTHAFTDRISAGLGCFVPFGLGTNWDDHWEGRYIATSSEIQTYMVNPVISYRLSPRVSLAAGVDFLWLDTTLEQRVNSAGIGSLLGFSKAYELSDGNQKFSGDGNGVGYNLGLAVAFTDKLTFGASYRSKVTVDIDGDVVFSDIPDALASTGILPDTNGNADMTLPAQFTAGVAYAFTDQLTVEVGMRWEGWSCFDSLEIEMDQAVLNQTSQTIEKKWHDTWTYNIGAEYQLTKQLALSAGYLYQENAVPDDTFEPSTPDSDCHLFCLGGSYGWKRASLALSYGYQLNLDRDKDNNVGLASAGEANIANGTYSGNLHLVSASLTVMF